jgi:hypothetical protein
VAAEGSRGGNPVGEDVDPRARLLGHILGFFKKGKKKGEVVPGL